MAGEITRRQFAKQTASGAAFIAGASSGAMALAHQHPRSFRIVPWLVFCLLANTGRVFAGQEGADWPVYGGDAGGMKYSRLKQINRDNVHQLEVAWSWKTGEEPIPEKKVAPGTFEATPLMIDDVLYLPTPYNRVVALDANDGREIWSYDPHAYDAGQPIGPIGFSHRGVASWTDGKERRIFMHTRWRLIALDAKTGKPIPDFGNSGEVDLVDALGWKGNKRDYDNTSPPVVFKDLVILGSRVADNLMYANAPPGDVLAFDVRTGKMIWRFRTIPTKGEFGNDTWGDDSWKLSGHANVWNPFVLDEKRGLLYLPVSTPGNDYYGGSRIGNNLFGDSLVCLDALTGKRVWHFQTVHHALWDYDGLVTPTLGTIHRNGKAVDIVAGVSKTGFTYVFNRKTGQPIWPIVERPVPQSDVPGEKTSPTQPFPTNPPPFAKQGFSLEDVVDFTPELRAMALEKLKPYRVGPIFTPPSLEGTVQLPGPGGGANWGGASFDPETETLYVKAVNSARVSQVWKAKSANTQGAYTTSYAPVLTIAGSIPIIRPPYGTVTAINLSKGDFVWQKPVGDMPAVRNNPLLRGVTLPKLGSDGRSGTIATAGGLLFISGGDTYLYALDKRNGEELWKGALESKSDANPMTYLTRSGRQYVVVATGSGRNTMLVAFALPTKSTE